MKIIDTSTSQTHPRSPHDRFTITPSHYHHSKQPSSRQQNLQDGEPLDVRKGIMLVGVLSSPTHWRQTNPGCQDRKMPDKHHDHTCRTWPNSNTTPKWMSEGTPRRMSTLPAITCNTSITPQHSDMSRDPKAVSMLSVMPLILVTLAIDVNSRICLN